MAGRMRRGDLLAYQTKHDAFLRELRQFHSSRGTAFNRPPRINGRDVDLYLLYSEVTSLGGWKKVNNNKSWPTVLELLHIPKDCPNAAFAIRHFYIRYLDQYERIHFLGEESDDDRGETTDIRGRKSHVSVQHLPTSYNHQQHDLTDAMRIHLGLNVDAISQSEYDKLVFSFLSGLPNEVDFAINVCTLLANDNRRGLHLDRCPRLLELLIAQAGVWSDTNSSIRGLLEDEWKRIEGGWSMAEFWQNALEDQDIKELLGPWEGRRSGGAEEDSLFNLYRQLGIRDREGQRVLQIAAILRNLAFEDSNVPILASSSVCLKFLLLCAHSCWANLRQLAFDTLGSLTTEMVLEPCDDLSIQILFRTITSSLQSNDRFLIIRGLEMLIGLCQVETNEDAIVRSLEHRVYERICALLTIPDIMLLVYTLECLYHITQLGKESCNIIARINGVIGCLVGLVTLEAQTFGPNACISMKLVESPTLCVNPVSLTSVTPSRPSIPTPQRVLASHGQRSISIPIPPGYQELDNETFVCNWLKATYETRPNTCVSHTSIYNDYQSVCIRLGKKGLIGPTQLANHLRAVFPFIQKKSEGTVSVEWDGLRKRDHPLAVSIITPVKVTPKLVSSFSQPLPELNVGKTGVGPVVNSSHSPILKAQLSAPPKSPVLRQHPHLHKALVSSSNPSSPPPLPPPPPSSSPIKESGSIQTPTTLIKSLLANKVSQNIQRQQQQQILKQQTIPVPSSPEKSYVLQPPQLPQMLLAVASVTTTLVTSTTTTVTSTSSSTQLEAKGQADTGISASPRAATHKIEPRLALFCPKIRLNGVQRQVNVNSIDRGKPVNSENLKNGSPEPSRAVDVVSTTSTSGTPPSIFKCQQLTSAQNSGINPFATLPPNLQPSQPPVNRKGGVLADLLDGKVNKEALLVMNGVIDRRPIATTNTLTPVNTTVVKMTNGEGPTTNSVSSSGIIGGVVDDKASATPTVCKDNALNKPVVNEVKLGPGIVRTVVNRFPNLSAATETQNKGTEELIGYPRVSYEQVKQLNQKVPTFPLVKRPLIVKPTSTVNAESVASINSDGLEVKRLKVEASCNTSLNMGDNKPIISSTLIVHKVTPALGTTSPTIAPLTGVGQQLKFQKQQQLQQQQQQQLLQTQQMKSPIKPLPQVQQPQQQQPRPAIAPKLEFICDWKDCKRSFDSPNMVYFHACKVHTPPSGPAASPCLWENCDQMVRQRLSLMTHIQERHCNEGVLRLQARRRQEMSTAGQSSIPNPPPPPPHPGYAPNAALHAIKRHALEFLNNKELTEIEKEGPVTKCIRLTAVLVLRNLSHHSSTGRRLIQRHEAILASVAISNVEASGTASHCLAYLTFPPKEACDVTR